ncbi:MAG: sulfite exporter TauE/SafE family protein [Thermodesulfovibrionales bacterium]|nr:sulfite exporter TauE/SafE family protein [Thermodesulfovibrionales bacterium]
MMQFQGITLSKIISISLVLIFLAGCASEPIRTSGHEPIGSSLDALIVIITGVFVGAIGTLVGAGGGFLHVPILLIFYGFSPLHAIGTSIVAVFLNALSGTFSYIQQQKIDYDLGVRFAVFSIPGVFIGSLTAQYFNLTIFSLLLAVVLIGLAYSLLFLGNLKFVCATNEPILQNRMLRDSTGEIHSYSPDLSIGYGGSFLVGITSGLFGIGGGLIHMPMMTFIGIPVHIAAATSHFIISITSFFGIMIFIALKAIDFDYAIFLGVGVILGAYYGARLSMMVSSQTIKRVIAGLLLLVAIRLIGGILL